MNRNVYLTLVLAGLALAVSPATARPAKKAAKPAAKAKKAPARPNAKPAPQTAAEPESGPPKVGRMAPDFTLLGGDEANHTLSDYRGRWVVLNFYPANFTSGCTAQVCGIRDQLADIRALDATPIGVSVQDLASHKKFRAEHNLNFPVLSDSTREVAARYGVLTAKDGVAKRVTYYIDPTGVVRRIDPNVQPFSAVKDIVANLNELQKDEPKPSLAASQAWDPRIREAAAAYRKNPSDQAARANLALAHYMKGRNIMLDTWLSPDLRYPGALQSFNEALKVNPNLAAARDARAAIEEEYKKMGKAVPAG